MMKMSVKAKKFFWQRKPRCICKNHNRMFEIRPAILQGGFRFFISLAKIHRMLKKKIAVLLFLPFFILAIRFSEAQTGANTVPVSLDSLHALGGLVQHGGNDSIRVSANEIFQNQV